MRVLVLGSGAREHALVARLASDPETETLMAAPGNPGIARVARTLPIDLTNVAAVAELAASERIDLTVVGPELPLSLGLADRFAADGRLLFGPTAAAARLESSKAFAKTFMARHAVPTARFHVAESLDSARAQIHEGDFGFPVVLKADGLAAGKGVVIAETKELARAAVHEFMEAKSLGAAGAKLVIEEFLSGEEASFHVFADEKVAQPMVAAQDHKRRFDGDQGPNTGGMGAYSIDTILTSEERDVIMRTIIRPTLDNAPGFTGILYAGLMMTAAGPKLLEYNTRFGDPETQAILPRLKTDLLEVLIDMAEHRLASRNLEWTSEPTASVVLVAGGYPGKVENGKRISGLQEASRREGVKIYHAGTTMEDGNVVTAGGRILNVTARGATLSQALDRAYAACEVINFDGKDYRKDIGKKGLAKQR